MKFALWILCFALMGPAVWAGNLSPQFLPYYGEDFYKGLSQGRSNEALIETLQLILRENHLPVKGGLDRIQTNCQDPNCYKHISLGYHQARVFMMGEYYLMEKGGLYALPDVYCGNVKTEKDFPKDPPGPHKIPLGTVLNTEHTWPQSKFTTAFNVEMQKSDLHHLYPVDTELNSIRGNNEFGEVVKDTKLLKCGNSRIGKPSQGGADVFEPPTEHKGNVARALFYFSVAYSLPISAQQEKALRSWHQEDPVDAEEQERNDAIFGVQKNRNPFVDYPELVQQIDNF